MTISPYPRSVLNNRDMQMWMQDVVKNLEQLEDDVSTGGSTGLAGPGSFSGLYLRTHPDVDKRFFQVYLQHADQIVMDDGDRVDDWNDLIADITVAGAGGLDTGSEASSTWYDVYAIYNPQRDERNILLHVGKQQVQILSNAGRTAERNFKDNITRMKIARQFAVSESLKLSHIITGHDTGGVTERKIWMEIYNNFAFPANLQATSAKYQRMHQGSSGGQVYDNFYIFPNRETLSASSNYWWVMDTDQTVADAGNFERMGTHPNGVGDNPIIMEFDETPVTGGWKTISGGIDFQGDVWGIRESAAVVMPAGFTKKALIGFVRNDASGNFIEFVACDRQVDYGTNSLPISVASVNDRWENLDHLVPPGRQLAIYVAQEDRADDLAQPIVTAILPGERAQRVPMFFNTFAYGQFGMASRDRTNEFPAEQLGPVVTRFPWLMMKTNRAGLRVWIMGFKW